MKISEDFRNYDKNNTSEEKVINAHFFSAYKRAFVLKLPIGYNAASFRTIFLGRKIKNTNVVKHEYGHRLQFDKLGFFRYISRVATPSVLANLLYKLKKLPYDYYGSPWENEADILGGVSRSFENMLWPDGAYRGISSLLKLFFRKKQI
jgi:hypothetical protein